MAKLFLFLGCIVTLFYGRSFASTEVVVGDVCVVVGMPLDVLPAGYMGLESFSDQPITVLSRSPLRYLVVGRDGTVLMRGRSLSDAAPVRLVLEPSPTGGFDDGYAGIGSVFRHGRKLLAVYHAERHFGEIHAPKQRGCNPTTNYWSLGLAVSTDGGESFRKQGQILTSKYALGDREGVIQGVGDATLCLDPLGQHLYAYYTNVTPNPAERNGICLARCRLEDHAAPGKWLKYFNGDFTEPGLGGRETLIVDQPFDFAGMCQPQVTYLKALKKYVMVCVGVSPTEAFAHAPPQKSGIFFSTSDDGLHWCVPQLLWLAHTIPVVDREYTGHPSLYVEKENGTRISGSLVYCYTPKFGTGGERTMHHLVRRPFTLFPNSSTNKTASVESSSVAVNGMPPFIEDRRSESAPQGPNSASARSTLSDRLKGTKWTRDGQPNNVFEWTNDGRLLQNGGNRKWTVLDDQSVEVRVPGKGGERVDRWVFADDLKTVVQHGDGGKWKSTWRQQGK